MSIKITSIEKLSEGQLGLELSRWPTLNDTADFNHWVTENNISNYVELKGFYRVSYMGDLDFPAMQIKPNAPENILTMCLLKWA